MSASSCTGAKDAGVPRYRHDCERCTWLGRWHSYDLYWCAQHPTPTVLARYGAGPYYMSGLVFAEHCLPLWEARRRARARGLLVDEIPSL